MLTTSQQHEEGIRAAITAGKDVYCEWPLTPTAAKSAELATLADAAGVKTQIGLQRQFAPAFRYVHDLIAQGYVGKVRSARMHVSVNTFGDPRECHPLELADRELQERRSDLRRTLLSSPLLSGGKAVELLGAHRQSVSRGHH